MGMGRPGLCVRANRHVGDHVSRDLNAQHPNRSQAVFCLTRSENGVRYGRVLFVCCSNIMWRETGVQGRPGLTS